MQHLHPKAKWLFFWSYSIVPVMINIPILFILTIFFIGGTWPLRGLILFIYLLFASLFFLFLYLWSTWAYNNYKYLLKEDVIRIERGVIWKKYSSIPYERVQNIDIHRGILARILGLSDLQIQTAGYSGYTLTEGRIPGLDPKLAEHLREELIKKVQGTKQGL